MAASNEKKGTLMTTENPMRPLLEALARILHDAQASAAHAATAMAEGQQNLAIGTILDLERTLPAAQALHTAVLTLHRLPRKGGAT